MKSHHVYQTEFVVAVFSRERELGNHPIDWAIAVTKPGSGQIAGHVLDNLVQVLFPLLSFED